MANRKEILKVLFSAIRAFNKTVSEDRRLLEAPDSALAGLDSVDLLNLSLELEEQIQKGLGARVDFFNLDRMAEKNPFETVATLADYVAALLESKTWA